MGIPPLFILIVAAALAACERGGREVVVYTSVDQVYSEPAFREFEKQAGVRVRAVFDTEETKSTGVLNRLIAEAANPRADVFWSGDPVRPFLLIERGLVEPYVSPEAAAIPEAYRSPDGTWTGNAARARVLLVNRARLGSRTEPKSIRDLADPRWKNEGAIANPLFGTTTMHVAALFSVWGEGQTKSYLEGLRGNGVAVASSNGEVKRLVVAGEVTFGLTDTDDAHQALEDGADVAVVYPDQEDGGTMVMPTTVVLMARSPNPDTGRKLVDFLLSPTAERMMVEDATHMPLRSDVPVPANVRTVSAIKAMRVDYGRVAGVMEEIQPWLRGWAGL